MSNLRNLVQTAKAYLDPQQIGYVIFYVTNQCNFRCDFCFYYAEIEKGRKVEEMSIDEIGKMTENIGPILQLSLTGGEPFLRKELAEITTLFIENCSARYITIPTNASLTDKMVRYLETILPRHPDSFFRLAFSIDGIGEEHDKNRSMPGSYEKIIRSYNAISPLRERFPNLVLDSNSVFTASSEDRMLDIQKTIDRDFDFDNLTITYARGNIKDEALKTQSKEKYLAVNDFLESVSRKKETRKLYFLYRGARDVSRENLIKTAFDNEFVTPCVAGKKLLVISETAEVHPCEILDQSMGNLRDVDFDIYRLMHRKENKDLVKWIKDSRCKCTFECALGANVVWNPSQYPRFLTAALKNIGQ